MRKGLIYALYVLNCVEQNNNQNEQARKLLYDGTRIS